MEASLTRIGLVTALALMLTACGGSRKQSEADKAGGGSTGPTVLRLGVGDSSDIAESRLVRYFAAQVTALSGGKLRIEVTFLAAGTGTPDVEARTAELVGSGRYDLGWIAARAWDELGVKSFQALQAPFLITNYPLFDEVVTSPLAGEMLAGLESRGVVGLALVPGLFRHPVGVERPLVSLADYSGARVRDLPSRATDALLRTLGATPVHVANAGVGSAMAQGRIDGEELSLINAPIGGIVTANVAFFPKALTLFAGQHAFSALSDEQQRVLRTAAERTVQHNASFPVRTALAFEGVLARQYCHAPGRIALATAQELETLVRASRPVYRQLEQDPRTRTEIAQIRAMKASLPPPPPIVVPSNCLGPSQPGGSGLQRSPGILNGTYHRLLTAAAARAFGPPANGPGGTFPWVITTVLRDGKWMANSDQPPDAGTYTVTGNEVVFRLGSDVMRFTFSRDPNGTLHLRPILPMDRGDQWFMAGARWVRVGPPVRSIP